MARSLWEPYFDEKPRSAGIHGREWHSVIAMPDARFVLIITALLGLASISAKAEARNDQAVAQTRPIDQEWIKAYRNLRAHLFFFRRLVSVECSQIKGFDSFQAGLPFFTFPQWPENGLSNIPESQIPFGLGLSHAKLTNEDFKKLSQIRNLAFIDLTAAKVTHVRLQYLAQSKSIAAYRYVDMSLGMWRCTTYQNGLFVSSFSTAEIHE